MTNKLGYMGFIGLLGLIGLNGNIYFFSFFGFFVYFRYFKVIPDELFKENVRKAATPSFFMGVIICILFGGYVGLTEAVSNIELAIGMTMIFSVPIILFTVILVYRELSEYAGGK